MSKSYSVRLTDHAKKQLRKMDAHDSRLLLSWINNKLEGCSDPRRFGKGLSSTHPSEWRYRVGNYRILADIYDEEVLIEVIKLAHRSKVYRPTM